MTYTIYFHTISGFYSWDRNSEAGYFNLGAMLQLKNWPEYTLVLVDN